MAHGSTGAGNDQVRFDVAFAVLLPGVPIVTPVRELGLKREQAVSYLEGLGLPVPAGASRYSVNAGLWGTTLGGGWTHDPWQGPPADAWPGGEPDPKVPAVDLVVSWKEGLPVTLNGTAMSGPALVEALDAALRPYGIGRGIHLGETVLGIKGRIGFEAGAAQRPDRRPPRAREARPHEVAVVLEGPRRAVLGRPPARGAGVRSGDARHRGDDRVEPAARRRAIPVYAWRPAASPSTGVRSPYSLMQPSVARYGESHALWTGEEARAFAKLAAVPSLLAARRDAPPEDAP